MSWAPSKDVLDAAMAHAEEESPNEACGLVIRGAYQRMANIHHEPNNAFEMPPRDLLAALQAGGCEAVVHSHVGLPPNPSQPDRTSCEQSNLPWLIVSVPTRTWSVLEPSGFRAPLEGRQFAWGVHDCYALIRDGLNEYAGVVLPDVERQWEFWIAGGEDVVSKLYPQLGFVLMPQGTPLQQCDLMVMRVRAHVPNHLGLFIWPDKVLHQMSGRLSVIESYGGVWQQLTEMHLRHRDLMIEAPLCAGPEWRSPKGPTVPMRHFSRQRNVAQ